MITTLSPIQFNRNLSVMPQQTSFTANKQVDLAPYRADLIAFPEDGKVKHLKLPTMENIPSTIKTQFEEALAAVPAERFHTLVETHKKTNDVFGIAEEATDLAYYSTIKAGFDSGVISKDSLNEFKNRPDVRHLLDNSDDRSFQLIQNKAAQEVAKIPQAKFEEMKEFFPNNSGKELDGLLKDFTKMLFVDYAVKVSQNRPKADFAKPDVITAQLIDESRELFDHIEDAKRPELPKVGEKKPALVANFLETLVDLTSEKLSTESTTVENFLKFQLVKSGARTEAFYKNPPSGLERTDKDAAKQAYTEVKSTSKAWEKVFEAAFFLQDLKV